MPARPRLRADWPRVSGTRQCSNRRRNPFLESFYRDRARNALATQLHFLIQRARQLDSIRQSDLFQNARVSDYLIEKDRMFARVNLGTDEFALYETVFERLVPGVSRNPTW